MVSTCACEKGGHFAPAPTMCQTPETRCFTQMTLVKFHDVPQDSCYHPIFTDEKPTTLIEQHAKVRQLVHSGAKIQTLVSLQHA